MYQTKTPGFLEWLMNAVTLSFARRTRRSRRVRVVPRRREAVVLLSPPSARLGREMYIESAWVSRWNR